MPLQLGIPAAKIISRIPAIMELKEIIDTQRQQLEEQIKKKEDFIAKQDELIQQLFKQLI